MRQDPGAGSFGNFCRQHVDYELELKEFGTISAEQPFSPDFRLFSEGEAVFAVIDPALALFLP